MTSDFRRSAREAFRDCLHALRDGFRLALCLPVAEAREDTRPMTVALLWLLFLGAWMLSDYLSMRPVVGFSAWGVIQAGCSLFAVIGAFFLGLLAVGQGGRGLIVQARVLPAFLLVMVLSTVYDLTVKHAVEVSQPATIAATVVALLILGIAAIRTVARLPEARVWHGAPMALLLGAGVMAQPLLIGQWPMFHHDFVAAAEEAGLAEGEEVEPPPSPDIEAAYYAQPALMDAALGALRPSVPGETELFAIVAGLYPEERVFLREVEAVGTILANRFDAEGRVVRLLNSAHQPVRHPMANATNLRRAVREVAGVMGEEDVLLFFLTSHGNPGVLSTGYAFRANDLYPEDLDSMLTDGGVAHSVIVVSACHSGSFVPALEGPARYVITAAAADRTSFGCGDAREWTYFGQAFF
ncbi:MAG: C13 family peptidase, partial [Pseudomonadota bacterium]